MTPNPKDEHETHEPDSPTADTERDAEEAEDNNNSEEHTPASDTENRAGEVEPDKQPPEPTCNRDETPNEGTGEEESDDEQPPEDGTQEDPSNDDVSPEEDTQEEPPSEDQETQSQSQSEDEETTSEEGSESQETDPSNRDEISFQFKDLSLEIRPSNITYTPEFDESWVETTGLNKGGGQDDLPVQGLSIGVTSTEANLEETIISVCTALKSYYRENDQYPFHRFIKDIESFRDATSGEYGLVAEVQTRPDDFGGLGEHRRALEEHPDEEAYSPNYGTASTFASELVSELAENDLLDAPEIELPNLPNSWEGGQQIQDTVLIERYAPLAASSLYDTTTDDEELVDQEIDGPEELPYDPLYLNGWIVVPEEQEIEENA